MEPAAGENRGLLTMQEPIVQSPRTVPGKRTRTGYPAATLRTLDAHLHGLRKHLLALGLTAEAAAVATELRLVADLRRA